MNEPPCIFHAVIHSPRFYRYVVADHRLRIMGNRYGDALIGFALVAGRYAYCVKWADAKVVPS